MLNVNAHPPFCHNSTATSIFLYVHTYITRCAIIGRTNGPTLVLHSRSNDQLILKISIHVCFRVWLLELHICIVSAGWRRGGWLGKYRQVLALQLSLWPWWVTVKPTKPIFLKQSQYGSINNMDYGSSHVWMYDSSDDEFFSETELNEGLWLSDRY